MNNDLSYLLNNPEVDRLADLYLAFLNLDRNSLSYRRLKNAVILSLKLDNMQVVYAELGKIDACTAAEIAQDIATTVNSLPKPIEQMFNETYCAEAEMGFMPHHKTVDNMVAFLGKTLLYILETNYPLLLL